MTIRHIHVTISTDSDGLVGAEGWGEYDASASLAELKRQVAEELSAEYECEVEVEHGLNARIYVTLDNGEDPEPYETAIGEIISEVWQRETWLMH